MKIRLGEAAAEVMGEEKLLGRENRCQLPDHITLGCPPSSGMIHFSYHEKNDQLAFVRSTRSIAS
jgi:hypothetical protein